MQIRKLTDRMGIMLINRADDDERRWKSGLIATYDHVTPWWRSWSLEWAFTLRFCFLKFALVEGESEGAKLAVAVPGLALWMRWGRGFDRKRAGHFEISAGIDECSMPSPYVRFVPWGREWEYNTADPWWRRGVIFNLYDFLFGKWVYSDETLKEGRVRIPLDATGYIADYRTHTSTWKRPRSPFKKVETYTTLTIAAGQKAAPFPGKGENSWDCGDDAIYGCSAKGGVAAAVARYVESTLRNRERYGGSIEWQPSEEVGA